MNNNLITFNFGSEAVRTVEIDGEVWFVVADICKVLGLTNPSMAVSFIDDEDKTNFDLGLAGRPVNIINESGLYTLLLRSDKPEARPFRRFVTKEVLPAIRRQGSYKRPDLADDTISVDELRSVMSKCVAIPVPEYLAMIGPARKTHDAPKPFSDGEKSFMRERHGRGVSIREISRQIGRHESSVRGFLKNTH